MAPREAVRDRLGRIKAQTQFNAPGQHMADWKKRVHQWLVRRQAARRRVSYTLAEASVQVEV